ncbi:MAG: zinc ribbon domain-containing protein [Ignavibacteria bacterium]|nr:zinc ribbon domain-containing protein [Ignavibacteria bacterium]
MPTYEYKCIECGNTFEYFQKMTDEPLETCENCGGHIKRLIGAGLSPLFKGSGFYHTDYKVNSPKPKTSTESSSEKKIETKKE